MLNLSGIAYALTIDIDAKPNNPVYLTLDAGYYEVTAFSSTFTAWNAWGRVDGDEDVYPYPFQDRPPVGWLNTYWINDVSYGDGMLYYTAQDALDNAITANFFLATEEVVKFSINDSNDGDNWGGMSLNVNPVPEPATMMLFGIGLLGLAAVSRRKK